MVAKSELKFIRSLRQKKYRQRHGLFVAEGVKLVADLLASPLAAQQVYTTDPDLFPEAIPISERDLGTVSSLVQPNKVLGVFRIPEAEPLQFTDWVLALDGVRDPGNLGTLIRLCDWFGIGQLLCSPDTVDAFNPKVLQATMGSIARVRVHYAPLPEILGDCPVPVYGASMEGRPVGSESLPQAGVLVVGSESHGLGESVRSLITATVSIPAFGRAESLNVATAAAILLYEIRRRGDGTIQR